MSSPAEFYHSLPPIIKFYGTACLLTTAGVSLRLLNPLSIAFDPKLAFKNLQLWRVVTNFFFLAPFSMRFGIQLLMLARYGVQLERSFTQRAQFAWMMVLAMLTLVGLGTVFSFLHFYFMGSIIVFMLVYLWSREFPNANVSIMGLVTIKGFYLPWAMLFINMIFGGSIRGDLMGMTVGHLYYFLTVLYPRAGGRDYLQAPRFFQQLLARLGVIDGVPRSVPRRPMPEAQQAAAPPSAAQGTAFRGRSYRLDRD